MLYAAECWAMRKKEEHLLNKTEMRMLRWIQGISLKDHVRSEEIRTRLNVMPIVDQVTKRRLSWYGHIKRRKPEHMTRTVLEVVEVVDVVEVIEVVDVVDVVEVVEVVEMVELVKIDCEKSIKLETSPKVTKSKRNLHWCRSISNKNSCAFFITVSVKKLLHYRAGGLLQYRAFYYIIGQLLHYRAFFITLSGTYYSIGRLLHYGLVHT